MNGSKIDTDERSTEGRQRVLTVGHSTHPIDEFISLLAGAGVTHLVDVRTIPGSRRNPQFNEEELRPSIEAAGLRYVREKRLGGLRSADRTVPPEVNGYWENQSFHCYADYALGEEFEAGLAELIALAASPRLPAIMCAEAVWWRCHRRVIADFLLARGVPVAHLMPDGKIALATLTPGAQVQAGSVRYPA